MRNEFEQLEREITKITDLLLGLADDNQEIEVELREKGDKFSLYHRGKYDAYNLAVDQLDTIRIIAKSLKDSANEPRS